jgi:diguanylate cyclase (GGDEF)-like protein
MHLPIVEWRMLTVLSCIGINHDFRYVLLAAVICVIGSHLALRLFARVRRSDGARRIHWLFLGGLVAGGSIWTTHFAAMLGYNLPVARAFEPTLTILSLLFAIGLTSLSFWIAGVAQRTFMVEFGGALLGVGIAVMHYTGMAAYQVAGYVTWDLNLVVWSVLLGAFFGALAMNRIARPVTRYCAYVGTLFLILAICSMHFTAMGAATIVPLGEAAPIPAQALSDTVMVAGVVVVILLIMATAGSAYMIDMHTAQEASEKYKQLAHHDALTGLPNRTHLTEHLAAELNRKSAKNTRIAVLAIDLDRFKDVNDVHGHGAGDAVLRGIAARLTDGLRAGEFVARVGGDELVAIKSDVTTRGEAVGFANRIRELIVQGVSWQEQLLSVGCSVGVAVFPDDGANGSVLLSRADLAMYRAKQLGRDQVCVYEPGMEEVNKSRAALAIDMKTALDRHEFELWYQPQNDVVTREIVGFEALIRWNHPERGQIQPADFISIAEESGLLADIGDWVLRTACRTAASWSKPYRVAVNVAAMQLARGDFPSRVRDILEEPRLAPGRLEIEITESGIIADQHNALKVMLALKAIGVTVAMDDFGTGYSSLSTLQNFPFNKIKIDRSFISNVATNTHSAAIVRATILLGKSLQVPVLAEGVETEDHLKFLHDEGCGAVQGFLFGRPMPVSDVTALIASEALAPLVAAGRKSNVTEARYDRSVA